MIINMEKRKKGGYLAPEAEVESIVLRQTILNLSGGFTLGNSSLTSGDGDNVWD